MDLIADRGRRVTVDELNTSRLLAHARKQAVQRKFDDMMIVDVDAHHYENEHSAASCVHGKRGFSSSASPAQHAESRHFTRDIGYQHGRQRTRYSRGTGRPATKAHARNDWATLMDAMSVAIHAFRPACYPSACHPQTSGGELCWPTTLLKEKVAGVRAANSRC